MPCASGDIVCAVSPGLTAPCRCYLRDERLLLSELLELLLLLLLLLLLDGALLLLLLRLLPETVPLLRLLLPLLLETVPLLRLLLRLCDLAAGADDLWETEGDDFCTVDRELCAGACDLL